MGDIEAVLANHLYFGRALIEHPNRIHRFIALRLPERNSTIFMQPCEIVVSIGRVFKRSMA